VIFERLADDQDDILETTLNHLRDFANEGIKNNFYVEHFSELYLLCVDLPAFLRVDEGLTGFVMLIQLD